MLRLEKVFSLWNKIISFFCTLQIYTLIYLVCMCMHGSRCVCVYVYMCVCERARARVCVHVYVSPCVKLLMFSLFTNRSNEKIFIY